MRSLISIVCLFLTMYTIPSNGKADMNFTISPRVWLLFDDFSFPGGSATGPSGNEFVGAQDPFSIWMYGASVSFGSTEFLSDTNFTLTALYGTDSTDRVNFGGGINTLPNGNTQVVFTENRNKQSLERIDIEFTAQTRLNDFMGWLAGFRYERTRIDFDSVGIFGTATTTNGPANPGQPGVPGTVFTSQQNFTGGTGGYDLYSLRSGLAGAFPVSDDGAHRLYGNLMAFVGYQEPSDHKVTAVFEERWLVGPDLSVGYLWNLTPSIGLDLRYRAIMFFPLSGESSLSAPEVTHGPNFAINISL